MPSQEVSCIPLATMGCTDLPHTSRSKANRHMPTVSSSADIGLAGSLVASYNGVWFLQKMGTDGALQHRLPGGVTSQGRLT